MPREPHSNGSLSTNTLSGTRSIIQNLDERFRVDDPDLLVFFKPQKIFITRHYKIGLRFNGAGNYLIVSAQH